MDIAVITYSWTQNWGAILQAYALVEYLNSNGHNCKLIDYREFDNKPISTVKSIQDGIYNLFSMGANRQRIEKINIFRQEYFVFTNKCMNVSDLKKLNKTFDVFITGSDQVWNVGLGVCKDFYLDFVEKSKKRISYAPSFGVSDIPQKYQKDTIEGLNNIQYLSVV